MKNALTTRTMVKGIVLALTITAAAELATAQSYGGGSSTSYSNSYSSNWGSSSGFGPGGFYQKGFNNQAGHSSFKSNNFGYSPYGGFQNSVSRNQGFQQSNGFSRGYSPMGGFHNNKFGGFNSYNNGNQSQRYWRW